MVIAITEVQSWLHAYWQKRNETHAENPLGNIFDGTTALREKDLFYSGQDSHFYNIEKK